MPIDNDKIKVSKSLFGMIGNMSMFFNAHEVRQFMICSMINVGKRKQILFRENIVRWSI